jgi:hypothetical protein
MDPTTQTNIVTQNDTITNTTTPTPPPSTNNTNTIIAGAFGGTLPIPPQISETMPAFSFDEDDFWNTNNNTTTPSHEVSIDPFAWGITSLTTNTTIQNWEWTISLDNLENTIQTEAQQDTSDQNTLSPETSTTQEVEITTNNENTTTDTNNISFDLPSETTWETTIPSFDLPSSTQTQETKAISLEVPSTETTTDSNISFDLPSNEWWDNFWTTEETPWPWIETTEETEKNNYNSTEEENIINEEENTDDTSEEINQEDWISVATSVSESRNDTTHELQEIYDDFKQAFINYTSFKNSDSITLTGLRTDEEEINYTFAQSDNNRIVVTKSNTSDTLSLEETESGIKAFVNEDIIGYYGVDQVDSDTTHYLKEKLGKFTMMLESEHEREERKIKEESKKTKDTLKNF